MPKTSEERFWSKVDKNGPVPAHMPHLGPCWLWVGHRDVYGYGTVRRNRKVFRAHRVSWEITFGEIQNDASYHGTCVLHHCDNQPCVNPTHLFLGTHQDNMLDMKLKGIPTAPTGDRNGSRTHKETKPRGENHCRAKLTEDLVRYIRASTRSCLGLGKELGVSHQAIRRVRSGITWAHVR